jgi:hypothetical protein
VRSASEIFQAIRRVSRVLTGAQEAGAGVTVFPDDVFLVSYPRSGNTWTRFLIANLLYPGEPCTFANIESRIPEIYFNPDWKLRRLPRPRILKSHQAFDPRYRRIIYIVRDPRDVAVSYYHHNIKTRNIPDGFPLDEFIPRFITHEFDIGSGSWADNVLSWLVLRQNQPGFLLLRYEDMQREPVSELFRVAEFLTAASFGDFDTSPQALARAVELSSADRIRRLEKEQAGSWVTTKWTRQDKPFVRTAKSGGWKSTLSASAVAQIERAWGPLMRRLGYEVTSSADSSSSSNLEVEAIQPPGARP